MKFITIRDLRAGAEKLEGLLKKSRKLALTSGNPLAILVPADKETIEDELIALRQAEALAAMRRIGKQSRELGLDRMTMDDIDRVISQTCKERRKAS